MDNATKLTWTKVYEHGVWHSNLVEHGMADEKGRKVGGYISISDGERYISQDENGKWKTEKCFWVRTVATRNGQRYGASPSGTPVKTWEEAVALAEKNIVSQGKRYAKKYAK